MYAKVEKNKLQTPEEKIIETKAERIEIKKKTNTKIIKKKLKKRKLKKKKIIKALKKSATNEEKKQTLKKVQLSHIDKGPILIKKVSCSDLSSKNHRIKWYSKFHEFEKNINTNRRYLCSQIKKLRLECLTKIRKLATLFAITGKIYAVCLNPKKSNYYLKTARLFNNKLKGKSRAEVFYYLSFNNLSLADKYCSSTSNTADKVCCGFYNQAEKQKLQLESIIKRYSLSNKKFNELRVINTSKFRKVKILCQESRWPKVKQRKHE